MKTITQEQIYKINDMGRIAKQIYGEYCEIKKRFGNPNPYMYYWEGEMKTLAKVKEILGI